MQTVLKEKDAVPASHKTEGMAQAANRDRGKFKMMKGQICISHINRIVVILHISIE